MKKLLINALFILLTTGTCTLFACLNSGQAPEYVSLTDSRDGMVYKTVKINGAIWLAENYRRETGNWHYPRGQADNVAAYGLLYDWATASSAGFCPPGWRLPQKKDYELLLQYVVKTEREAGSPYYVLQDWLKSLVHLYQDIRDSFNSNIARGVFEINALRALEAHGFGVSMAGSYDSKYESYYDFGAKNILWTANFYAFDMARSVSLGKKQSILYHDNVNDALSVRCIKNSN